MEIYARLGFATVPLRPREKRPLRKGWRMADPGAWDDVPPDANVGVLTGAASGGLVVLDFDTKEAPFEVLGLRPRELAARTIVVETARGWHVYLRGDDLRTRSPLPGLDIRGDGSLVVAPPSVHPSGATYRFVTPPERVARWADVVMAALEPEEKLDEASSKGDVDWEQIEAWVALQAPKLRESWRLLREGRKEFDRSRADFAVARCLWEAGYANEQIVAVLLTLPGSKARERGEAYAARTVARATTSRAHRGVGGGLKGGR